MPYSNNSNSKSGVDFWLWINTLIWIMIPIALFLKFVVYQQVTVVGASMEPNYYTGELLLVNQINRNFNRGQVVAVYSDKDIAKTADYFTRFKTVIFLKRVVGMPGEEIEILGSKVIIYNQAFPNGAILQEDYIADSVKKESESYCEQNLSNCYFPKTKIPQNHYFLLGDNRVNSTDSRAKGSFPDYSIFGQETLRFWPFPRKEFFKIPEYKWRSLDPETKKELEIWRQKQSKNFSSLFD